MEGRRFQIITSISLSCFAKERCIPWNINFKLSDLSHKYVVIWQWFWMKVCYSTAAGIQCCDFGGTLCHGFPPVGWWRWTVDACYAYSRAPVTQPESHPLLGVVQNHLSVSSCPSASIGAYCVTAHTRCSESCAQSHKNSDPSVPSVRWRLVCAYLKVPDWQETNRRLHGVTEQDGTYRKWSRTHVTDKRV
jgi:hypothetical protein